MEKNKINESIAAINRSLGIDLETIVNDTQLESQQKLRLIYKEVLTALLTKWIKNDEKGVLGLPADFNVKNFVEAQLATLPVDDSPMVGSGTMQCIPNLLLMPKLVEEVKRAKGDKVTVIVEKLFDMTTAIMQNERFDLNDCVNILLKFGIFAVSLIGGAAAIATLASLTAATSGASVLAAMAGATAAGIAIISSFLIFLYSCITSGILFDRSFFGVVLNDTDKDLTIPNWKDSSNAKKRYCGIYCRHGWLSGLMVDDYHGGQVAVIGKREKVENEQYCYCGLYLLEKNTGANGSEGFFRFDNGTTKFDVNATCPMSSHNRVYASFNHTNKDLYKANSDVANEWKDKIGDAHLYGTVSKGATSVTYSLNKMTGSPAYGIISVVE